jgi:hypothetical protein
MIRTESAGDHILKFGSRALYHAFVGGMAALALLAFVLAPATADTIVWDEKFYNPKPGDSDFILPTPCGGAMTFLPVALASESLMRDQSFPLGSSDPDNAFTEGTRTAYLSGSFGDVGDQARRYFYIAKYELTADQASAIRGDCPKKPSVKGRIPALGLNWHDAVSISHLYSHWLVKNHPERLPREDGQIGYVRLPTEAEWEYSARGGLMVSPSEFVGRLFPLDEKVDAYIWYSSTSSANGKPRPAGLKKPNPLGLHDIIGNAEEIVFDSYRLTQFKRLHGQAGGYQVRGAGYLTDKSALRTSYRQEIPHFDANGEKRVPTVGVRFAIGAPVITSRERLLSFRKEWNSMLSELSEQTEEAAPKKVEIGLGEQSDNPLAELNTLSKAVQSDEIRERLNDLSLRVSTLIDTMERQRRAAINSLLRQGGLYEQSLAGDANVIARFEKAIETMKKTGTTASRLKRILRAQDERKSAHEGNVRLYADLIVSTGSTFDIGAISSQRSTLNVELKERKFEDMILLVERFYKEIKGFKKSNSIDFDTLMSKFSAEK